MSVSLIIVAMCLVVICDSCATCYQNITWLTIVHKFIHIGSILGIICNYNKNSQIFDMKIYFLFFHISMG